MMECRRGSLYKASCFINEPIPVSIICIAIAITTSPVRRIIGPTNTRNSSTLEMLLLVHIAKRFISNAGVRAKRVDKNPYWIEKEIVAAIVPGPAISGAARGTTDNSSGDGCFSSWAW